MFNKIKRFFSRKTTCKAVNQTVSNVAESEAKGEQKMENENKTNEPQVEEAKPTEKDTEKKVETPTEGKPVEAKKTEETPVQEEQQVEPQPQNAVTETVQEGNAIPLDQVVLKTDLQEALLSLNAKLDALIDENKKLKDQLGDMHDKYETKDFGGYTKKGMQVKDKVANDTFDSYSKQFM